MRDDSEQLFETVLWSWLLLSVLLGVIGLLCTIAENNNKETDLYLKRVKRVGYAQTAIAK